MFVEINKEILRALPFAMETIGETSNQGPVNRKNGYENFHHLIWVKEGEGSFCIDGECFTLTAGEGAFMPRGVPHSYSGKGLHSAWITFSMPAQTLEYLGAGRWFRFLVPDYLNADHQALCRLANGDSSCLQRSVMGYEFVMTLFSKVLTSNRSMAGEVQRLLEYRYSEPLSLLEIAEAVGSDRFSVCRAYKEEFGTTVMAELLRIRIAKAKQLLRYGTDTVGEVGRACGFESTCYFIKRFRESVGMTPAAYRKSKQ